MATIPKPAKNVGSSAQPQALDYDPKEIEGVVGRLAKYKDDVPLALEKCLAFFEGVDRSIGGYEGLMTAQACLASNEARDQFLAQFNVLKNLWEALTPDPFLQSFKKDYRWLAQVYDSVRPVGGLGSLIWQSLGPETIRLIHQNTDIAQIRDDLDELVMDKDSIFTLTEAEQNRRAKKLEISLMAKIRNKSNDLRYIRLGERLEKLCERYESGVLSSINWLKSLLDAAREAVHLDNGIEGDDKIIESNKTALAAGHGRPKAEARSPR